GAGESGGGGGCAASDDAAHVVQVTVRADRSWNARSPGSSTWLQMLHRPRYRKVISRPATTFHRPRRANGEDSDPDETCDERPSVAVPRSPAPGPWAPMPADR